MESNKHLSINQCESGKESNQTIHSKLWKLNPVHTYIQVNEWTVLQTSSLGFELTPVGSQIFSFTTSAGFPTFSFFNLINQRQTTSLFNPKHDLWVSENSPNTISFSLHHFYNPIQPVEPEFSYQWLRSDVYNLVQEMMKVGTFSGRNHVRRLSGLHLLPGAAGRTDKN